MGSATPQNQVELWQLYMKGLQKLSQLWVELLRLSLESMSRTVVGDRSALFELSNLYWNIYEKTFGSFLQSPSLGSTREFNHKLLEGFDTWINFSRASFDYQLVLLDVWARAFEELIRELASSEEKGKTVQNWQQFLQLWSSLFDRVFAETFRSEDTLQIQGKFLNAAMTYRLQQQKLVEVLLKMYDLPSRSEVDEVHRTIYELRKEIKSLKKALAQSQTKG
jgi:class III poly(R)-hydroxyalkanoic acid synthase PhaE subunit